MDKKTILSFIMNIITAFISNFMIFNSFVYLKGGQYGDAVLFAIMAIVSFAACYINFKYI